MRVDIEGGKYTYIFEGGRARLLRDGQPSRRDVAGDKLIYYMAAEIAQLRDAEMVVKLRQQLAAFHSAVEHVTDDGCTRRSVVAMPEGWAMVHKDRLHELELAEEKLAATDGLDQYILCEKEQVVWMQSDHLSKFIHHACGSQADLTAKPETRWISGSLPGTQNMQHKVDGMWRDVGPTWLDG